MWLKVNQTLVNHHKLIEAADDLSIQPVALMGMLVSFWLWALDNAPYGNLGRIKPVSIARAAQWDGDPVVFIEALKANHWLDECEDGTLSIHDWDEYGGKIVRDAEKDSNRKKIKKPVQDSVSRELCECFDGVPTDIQRNSSGTPTEFRRNSNGIPVLDKDKDKDIDIDKDKATATPLPPSKGEEAAEAAVQRDKSDQVSADPVPYEKIKGLYNSICTSLPKIVSVSGKRRKAVSGRWREYKDLAVFETLFRKTQASAFMRGEMGGDWRGPDFDWLMCSSNMAKVLEGKYDDEHDIIPDGGMSYGGAGGFYTNARAYPSQTAGSRDAPRYKYGKVI